MLRCDPAPLGRIRAHAAAAWPREACGILGGPAPDRLTRALPLPNRAAGGRAFRGDPIAFSRAEAALRAEGLRHLGFYHSHPATPAVPSGADRATAWPGLHLIAAVGAEGVTDLRAWRAGAGGFAPIPWECP